MLALVRKLPFSIFILLPILSLVACDDIKGGLPGAVQSEEPKVEASPTPAASEVDELSPFSTRPPRPSPGDPVSEVPTVSHFIFESLDPISGLTPEEVQAVDPTIRDLKQCGLDLNGPSCPELEGKVESTTTRAGNITLIQILESPSQNPIDSQLAIVLTAPAKTTGSEAEWRVEVYQRIKHRFGRPIPTYLMDVESVRKLAEGILLPKQRS